MADAQDLLDNLDQLDVEKIAVKVLSNNLEVVADLNASQMAIGRRSDNTEILPSYADMTIAIKKAEGIGLGSVTDHVTLYMTGEHYKELFAEMKGKILEIGSTVPYSEDLEEKYDTANGKIHWLNEDSKEELAVGYLSPQFKEQVEIQTGLKYDS